MLFWYWFYQYKMKKRQGWYIKKVIQNGKGENDKFKICMKLRVWPLFPWNLPASILVFWFTLSHGRVSKYILLRANSLLTVITETENYKVSRSFRHHFHFIHEKSEVQEVTHSKWTGANEMIEVVKKWDPLLTTLCLLDC